MATLTGSSIASTYTGLLSVSGAVGADTVEAVTDGAGTSTSLSLSQQRATITLGSGAGDDFIVDGTTLVVEGDNNRVGIGTDAPTNDLFIATSASFKGITVSGDIPTIELIDSAGSILKLGHSDSAGQIGTRGSTPLYFFTNDTTAQITAPDMMIDTSGNVGIGGSPVSGAGVERFLYIGDAAHAGVVLDDTGSTAWEIYNSGGSLYFWDETGPANQLQLSAGGDVTLFSGNLVIGIAGKGIDFSATSDGTTMTSELLDDYEEGTWSPAVTGQTSGNWVTGNSTTTAGYTKIGNLVHVQGTIEIISDNGADGNIKVSLPFTSITSAEVSDASWGVATISDGGTSRPNGTFSYTPVASAHFLMPTIDDAGTYSYSGSANLDDAFIIRFGFTYQSA